MNEADMTIFKATVAFGGNLMRCDAIAYDAKLWLVPNWLDTQDGIWTMPTRIIRFDNLDYSDARGTSLGDYVVSNSMPKELFGARTPTPPIDGYEYLELPNIRIARSDRKS